MDAFQVQSFFFQGSRSSTLSEYLQATKCKSKLCAGNLKKNNRTINILKPKQTII